MRLTTGMDGGFALAAWPGTSGTSANASPQGPRTAAAQGFGTQVSGNVGLSGHTVGVLSVGTIALAALVWIWWALPR